MSPFSGHNLASTGVGLTEEKQASLEEMFASDSKKTAYPNRVFGNYGAVVVSNALATSVFSFIRFTSPA